MKNLQILLYQKREHYKQHRHIKILRQWYIILLPQLIQVGGVKRGSNAQEECLCRCSGLYVCSSTQTMWDGFYSHRQAHNPIYNDDIIYTPAVTVFKTDTEQPEIMDASDWYNVDVITCAAPNLRVKNNYNGVIT